MLIIKKNNELIGQLNILNDGSQPGTIIQCKVAKFVSFGKTGIATVYFSFF